MPFPAITPTTEIEAVNVLLATISESPINEIEEPQTTDVALAVDIIREISREVQSRGWYFNTEKDYPLSKDGDNKFPLPTTLLRIRFDRNTYSSVDPVPRGGYLYDRKTFGFTFTITELKAKELVLALPFTDLPESARRYITVRSARRFADRVQGAASVHAYTQQDEFDAWRLLLADEANVEDYNALRNISIYSTVLR